MTTRVVEGALDPAGLARGTEDPTSGALVVLTGSRDGRVAAASGGRRTGSGSLADVDGSEEDVDRVLGELEDEARGRFDVRRCRLRVRADAPPGEPAVAAVVRARHRRAAFDAARWAVTSALGRLSEAAPAADGEGDDPGRPAGGAPGGSPGADAASGAGRGEAPGRDGP